MDAIGNADRLPLLGAIRGEIRSRQLARLARIALHRVGDVAGDLALVKGLGSVAGNRREGLGEGRIGELVAGGPRPSLGIEEISARFRREACRVLLGEQLGEAGRDGEAVAGKRDGRLEQLCPGKLAVFVMGELQRRKHAGDADRKSARHGGVARQRISLFIEKELGCGGGWRRLAAVDAFRAAWRPRPNKG